MPTEDEIQQQLGRLAILRKSLALLLDKQAKFGDLHVPTYLIHEIDATRAAIEHLKDSVRGWGGVVDDHPDDTSVTIPVRRTIAWPRRVIPPVLYPLMGLVVMGLIVGAVYIKVQNTPRYTIMLMTEIVEHDDGAFFFLNRDLAYVGNYRLTDIPFSSYQEIRIPISMTITYMPAHTQRILLRLRMIEQKNVSAINLHGVYSETEGGLFPYVETTVPPVEYGKPLRAPILSPPVKIENNFVYYDVTDYVNQPGEYHFSLQSSMIYGDYNTVYAVICAKAACGEENMPMLLVE